MQANEPWRKKKKKKNRNSHKVKFSGKALFVFFKKKINTAATKKIKINKIIFELNFTGHKL